jgi:hypothetical protein
MEVKVNGNYIELGDSLPAITKKSIDINNPSARFIDYTNKFQVPDTDQNRVIFESPYAIGSNNKALDKLYNVEIEDIFRIFAGTGTLTDSTWNKYNLQVVDDATNFFKNLDVRLNSLSDPNNPTAIAAPTWDDCDTELTEAAIAALQTASPDNCWVWGKLCLHENARIENTDQATGVARLKYSRPSFYLQAFLKRAIELNKYTYILSTIDLAISAYHSLFYFTSYQKTFNAAYTEGAITGLDTNDFAHADVTVTTDAIDIGVKKTIFRLRGIITTDATASIVIRGTDNADPTKVTESTLVLGIGSQLVDFTTSEFFAETGMTIDVRVVGPDATVSIAALLYTNLNDKDFDLSTNPFYGYKIKVYDNLPDLTYLDLFRTMCVIGNQYHKVDNFSKVFSWETLANVNKNNAADWSDKFIITSEATTSGFTGVYQKNWLKYNNDITVNPKKGWSFFPSDNKILSVEGDYLVLKYGASNDVTINGNEIAQMKVYSDAARILTQPVNMRLFKIEGTRLVFEPISWTNLIENNYKDWFNALYRIRVITCDVALTKLDVLAWQPKQLVYIDYFKTVFIVLEINNFIPGKKTKVKLLGYGR